MKITDKALALAGPASRAGRLVSGEAASESSIKAGKACLVLIAEDASANTQKKFTDSCRYYEVPFRILSDRESLGNAIGKDFRSTVAIEDAGFAKAILKEIDKKGAE